MSDEIVNKDIENLTEKFKVQRRQWKLSKKWRKSSEVTNAASYGWPINNHISNI